MNQKIIGRQGSVLLLTMILMVVLLIIVSVFIHKVIIDMHLSRTQSDEAQAFYIANAGIQKAMYYLGNTAPDGSTGGTWRTSSATYPATTGVNATTAACSGSNPCREPLYLTGTTPTFGVYPTSNKVIGYYTIWVVASSINAKIISQGNYNGVIRTVSFTVTITHISGPVGWWKFDEASSGTCPSTSGYVVDSSGNSHNGTCSGSSRPSYVAGELGDALSFNGTNDNVNVSGFSMSGFTAMTVSLWIKVNAGWTSVDEWPYLISIGNSQQFCLQLNPDASHGGNCPGTGTLCVGSYTDGGASGGSIWGSTFNLADGNWHNVVVVLSGGSGVDYIDGSAVTTVGTQQNVDTSGSGLNIGDYNNSGNYFDGVIDDVRIYNFALTAGEVSNIYAGNTSLGVLINGMMGTWKECSTTTC